MLLCVSIFSAKILSFVYPVSRVCVHLSDALKLNCSALNELRIKAVYCNSYSDLECPNSGPLTVGVPDARSYPRPSPDSAPRPSSGDISILNFTEGGKILSASSDGVGWLDFNVIRAAKKVSR